MVVIKIIVIIITIIIIIICPWYFIPKGEEINQRDYNALGASRLVKKLGRWVPE